MTPTSESAEGVIRSSTRANIKGFHVLLDDEPAYAEYNERILKTLRGMEANNKSRRTIKSTTNWLRLLNRKVDLMNPDAVKAQIAIMKTTPRTPQERSRDYDDQTKAKIVYCYNYFVISNGLAWEIPKYRPEPKVPITPNKQQTEAIIASAPSFSAATIFRILLESGFEGEELHCTTQKDIDTEQGKISVQGHKHHNSRTYKFGKNVAEMLRVYMAMPLHQREHPFPKSEIMGDQWTVARNRAAERLGRPDLRKIPLKGLRNLSGILFWQKRPDPWLVMLHMGHKSLDTTTHYLQAMSQMNLDMEYICITASTKEERIRAIELNAVFIEKVDDISYYRLPKTDEILHLLGRDTAPK